MPSWSTCSNAPVPGGSPDLPEPAPPSDALPSLAHHIVRPAMSAMSEPPLSPYLARTSREGGAAE